MTGKVSDKDVGGKSREVMSQLNDIHKPNNVKMNVGGATDDINTAMSQLAIAMLAAIIIVYLILVITFKVASSIYNTLLITIYCCRCCIGSCYNWRNNFRTKFNWYVDAYRYCGN